MSRWCCGEAVASCPLRGTPGPAAGPWPRTWPGRRSGRPGSTAGAGQSVPGMLEHAGPVHDADPVGHFPGAARVLPLHARCGGARLLLARLVQRPGHQAAAAATTRSLLQARDGEPAHRAHRGGRVPDGAAEQPPGLIRCPVARRPAIVQPLRLARPPASALRYFPACSHGSGLAKQGRSTPRSSRRFRAPSRAPILTAAAAQILLSSQTA
jgi:hypothetical protein